MWFSNYFCIDVSKCKSRKKMIALENQRVGIATCLRLINEALDRYHLEGLPDTCSERVILESLLFYSSVVFFEEGGSLLALPGVPSGDGYNLYGDPTSAWVFSRNGMFNKQLGLYVPGGETDGLLRKGTTTIGLNRPQRGVLVWENKARSPFILNTVYYAEAISDTLRTIDVNRKWLKRPFIPVCEESLVPSVKEMLTKMESNEDFIPVSTGVMDISRFDLKPVDVSPQTVKAGTELVEWYENKYRELCGTDSNTQMDKKGENLIEAELNANNEYTEKQGSNVVDYLNEQLELVNQVFGTNIKAVTNKIDSQKEVKADDDDI